MALQESNDPEKADKLLIHKLYLKRSLIPTSVHLFDFFASHYPDKSGTVSLLPHAPYIGPIQLQRSSGSIRT